MGAINVKGQAGRHLSQVLELGAAGPCCTYRTTTILTPAVAGPPLEKVCDAGEPFPGPIACSGSRFGATSVVSKGNLR
jgi:hypothetical protein